MGDGTLCFAGDAEGEIARKAGERFSDSLPLTPAEGKEKKNSWGASNWE
jgi:hypothetical protein